jgi:hypothetical protein
VLRRKRQRDRHRLAHRAERKMRDARKAGRIVTQPCQVCGAPDVHGHHPDHAQPRHVVWLCPPHHRELHLAVAVFP